MTQIKNPLSDSTSNWFFIHFSPVKIWRYLTNFCFIELDVIQIWEDMWMVSILQSFSPWVIKKPAFKLYYDKKNVRLIGHRHFFIRYELPMTMKLSVFFIKLLWWHPHISMSLILWLLILRLSWDTKVASLLQLDLNSFHWAEFCVRNFLDIVEAT